ncbi:MAG: DUF4252 domain-containing protein [Bacteroidota bacterium]
MKTSFFALLFCLCSSLYAQPAAIQALAKQYPDDEVRNELTLSGSWLKMLTSNDDAADEDKGYLNVLHFLSVPMDGRNTQRFSQQLEREGYELLTSFRSNGDQGYLLIKEARNRVTDLVAIFNGEQEKLTTISVSGDFSLDDLNDVDIDVDGWDHVKKRGRQ